MTREEVETKPLSQRILETLFSIMRVQRHRGQPANLTPGETFVLSIIHHRSDRSGVRVSEIASVLRVTPSSITQFVKSLVNQGLVERKRADDDRRVVLLQITDRGERVMDESMQRMISLFDGVVESLGEKRSKTLHDLLVRVLEHLDDNANGNCEMPES